MSRGTVVITGASSGLGAEMARQFAALGYDLGLCARRTDRLHELRTEILGTHPERTISVKQLDVVEDAAVFTVFDEFAREFGTIDRVVVNAGLGKGAPLGTGRHDANRQTATVNFLAALTQTEAAMTIFRAQGHGHLVMISSISALRGMPKTLTTYAATKAGVAALADGLRAEAVPGVDVSVIYPGYIRSEMNDRIEHQPKLMVDTETGVRAMVAAIEKRRPKAYVPTWPWLPLGYALRLLPTPLARKLL